MASYSVLPSGKWRAQVSIHNSRESRSFRTKREAVAWASTREHLLTKEVEKRREIVSRHGPSMPKDIDALYETKHPVPNTSGIYVLFNEGVPTYVGKSMNVLARINSHAEKGRVFTHYSYIACPPEELDKKEAKLIKDILPSENKPQIATK